MYRPVREERHVGKPARDGRRVGRQQGRDRVVVRPAGNSRTMVEQYRTHVQVGRSVRQGRTVWKTQRHAVTTLSEIGIQKKQSERWQSIAGLPKQDFEGYIPDNKQGQKEITTGLTSPRRCV